METPVTADPPRGRPGGGGVDADGRPLPGQPRHLVDADQRPCSRSWTRPPPAEVLAAADGLGYRDFLTVALVVPEAAGFPDNWIYVHSPDVRLGRIQNFGSWSPYLVKEGRTCLGLEYFVFEGDDLWTMADDDLVELGKRELADARAAGRPGEGRGRLRGADAEGVPDVRRRPTRPTSTSCGRGWPTNTPNVYPGRPQRDAQVQQPGPLDVHGHALGGEHPRRRPHDIWAVNVEEEYHEEKAKASPAEAPTS